MALPAVSSFEDCASWAKTVAPYIPQLYALPRQLLQAGTNTQELKSLYIATNPLISGAAFSLLLSPIFWLASVINRNYSQVDRFWSILPTFYLAHYVTYAHLVGLDTERLDSMLVVYVIWSIRLTYNYWRRGGYKIGSEDYRWMTVKAGMSEFMWQLFNIVFVAFAQNVLLFIVTTPAYILLLATKKGMPMETVDLYIPRAIILLIFTEIIADQQQWNYQKAKSQYRESAKVPFGYDQEDLDRGFIANGLFQWSRHPSWAAEQTIWVSLYQWSCMITNQYFNWTAIGALSYLALFQGSTWLTEKITASKYPLYKEYQRRVGKFLPNLTYDETKPGNFYDMKAKPKVVKPLEEPKSSKKKN